jgi:low affinity Fe/Cu permease
VREVANWHDTLVYGQRGYLCGDGDGRLYSFIQTWQMPKILRLAYAFQARMLIQFLQQVFVKNLFALKEPGLP